MDLSFIEPDFMDLSFIEPDFMDLSFIEPDFMDFIDPDLAFFDISFIEPDFMDFPVSWRRPIESTPRTELSPVTTATEARHATRRRRKADLIAAFIILGVCRKQGCIEYRVARKRGESEGSCAFVSKL